VKYFVTGGAGFIGSHYVDLLLSETQDVEQVTVYDKFTYAGNARNLEVHKNDSRLKVLIGDICDSKDVKSALTGHDVIVHFAAESHVDRSIQDSGIFVQTNVMGTYNLLETARLLDIKSFIHISTDEVYGSLEGGSATEDSPLMPNSPYAASKASSDLLARSYFVTHGMDVRITRCSGHFALHWEVGWRAYLFWSPRVSLVTHCETSCSSRALVRCFSLRSASACRRPLPGVTGMLLPSTPVGKGTGAPW
jgi:dTDP-glucose 4,6-dehydratase